MDGLGTKSLYMQFIGDGWVNEGACRSEIVKPSKGFPGMSCRFEPFI